MPVLTSEQRPQKRKKIRYTEYYDMQATQDRLYADSVKGKTFNSLMSIIACEENILLAYRTIKGNKGSNTPGVDGRTIRDLARLPLDRFVSLIQRQFRWYSPRPVKRVEIPKPNGKTRPLGIPTIVDRIVQQCILQVLEPICEAKFHESSNGFRPNRGAESAIAQCCRLIQIQKLHYVVDIDIKGFFDNVCHSKLIRQMWGLGIRDKTLICIIKAMLKAKILLPNGDMITPDRGCPQGGVLSPLLSNIVLNELDWWIASQWVLMPTHYPYRHGVNQAGRELRGHTYRALRESRLKEMYIVRYADDFKVFCRSHSDAKRAFDAIRLWLHDRLGLEINLEKSSVINLRKRYSEFLGFKLKAVKRGSMYKVHSHMGDKAKEKARDKIAACITRIQHPPDGRAHFAAIQLYNATVAGLHNYYQFATHINEDFCDIASGIKQRMWNRLKGLTRSGTLEPGWIKDRYGKSKQLRFLNGHPLIPVGYIRTKNAMHKKRSVNRYTTEGRAEIHRNLGISTYTMLWLMRNPAGSMTVEFADNRISLFAAQYGRCAVTDELLLPHNVYCHHKYPKELGGNDNYSNLILVTETVHILIHASLPDTIADLLKTLNLSAMGRTKLNKLRILAGNNTI